MMGYEGVVGCGGWGGQGCTCMRSVLAIRGIYLSKALTKEPVHGGLPARLVVAVPRLTVPPPAVLQTELIHLIQRVSAKRQAGHQTFITEGWKHI